MELHPTATNPAPGRTFTCQDSCLHCCAKCNRLIRIDRLTRLFPVEEFLDHGLHFRYSCGASDKHDFMHTAFVDTTITHALLNWSHGISEIVHVEFLKPCT